MAQRWTLSRSKAQSAVSVSSRQVGNRDKKRDSHPNRLARELPSNFIGRVDDECNGDFATVGDHSSIISSMHKLCLLIILASTPLWGQETAIAKEFAGCYVLHVPARHPAMNRAEDVLPKRFQLTSRPAYDPHSTGKIFVAQNLDSNIRWSLSPSSWTVGQDGSLQIIWSTGYVGYGIKLTGSKGSFRGTAHYWTDTDPLPMDQFTKRNSTAVSVDRVECKDSEK